MLHNRQFILASQTFIIDNSWKSLILSNGFHLSYQENLPVCTNEDKSVCIIGDVWQVDISRPAPQNIIKRWNKNTSLNDIYEQEETWCGRYLILTEQYVLLDATGNLGCFYTEGVISSSLCILVKIANNQMAESNTASFRVSQKTQQLFERYILRHEEILRYQEGNADYIPGQITIDNRIKRLLPSLKYDYIKDIVSYRPLLYKPIENNKDNITIFENMFLANIEKIFEYYKDYYVWLPISGGKDSRACYAAFEKLKKEYGVYTFYNPETNNAGSPRDYRVARKLCKKTGKPLLIVTKMDDPNDNLTAHSTGLTRASFSEKSYNSLLKGEGRVLQVKNCIWEIVCNYYYTRKILYTPDAVRRAWKESAEFCEQSIEEWLVMVQNDTINTSISFSDRVYWDLRCGCWLADGMQGLDRLENIETINIFNCRRFFSILMGLDIKTRSTKFFEVELANKWCPAFANVPYEEEYYDMYLFANKWKDKIIRKIKKIYREIWR